MTTQNRALEPFSLPAAASMVGKQYRLCYINTSGQWAVVANGTTKAQGVSQHEPASGEQLRCEQTVGGPLKVTLGGTVTVGAKCSADTAGKGVVSVTSGDYCHGIFLDAGVSGDVVRVLFRPDLANVP